jgi:hypothetical protein
MKYFLFFFLCLAIQPAFSQTEARPSAPKTAADSAVIAARRFEGRLVRLREAIDKNDVSSMTSCYSNLLGDVRSAVDHEAQRAPEAEKTIAMQAVFAKFEDFTFDPMKPAALKPYLAHFDEFLVLLKK